ncbi:hypothetical protein [Mycoplasma sp. 5370]
MKTILKNNFKYLFKTHTIWILLVFCFLSSFSVIPVILSKNNLINYNWFIFYINFVICAIISFTLIYLLFIGTKRNFYDGFQNTLFSSKRVILFSKIITIYILFSVTNFLVILNQIIISLATSSELVVIYITLLNWLVNNFVFILFSFIFLLIIKIFKSSMKNILINSMITSTFILIPVITRSTINYSENYKNPNIFQAIELSKENKMNYYNVSEKFLNYKNKEYFDFIESLYLLSILVFKENMHNNIKHIENKGNYNTLYQINQFDKHDWDTTNNEYFLYKENQEALLILDRNSLLSTLNFSNINKNINYENLKVKINKDLWDEKDFSDDEILFIRQLNGLDNINIQTFKRDFIYFLKDQFFIKQFIEQNSQELFDFLNLLFIKRRFINDKFVNNKLSKFYVESLILNNKEIDFNSKIDNQDFEFISQKYLIFKDNKVWILNSAFKYFEVDLSQFHIYYSNINTIDDWKNYLISESFSIQNLSDKLKNFKYLSNNENKNYEFEFLANKPKITDFQYVVTNKISVKNKFNYLGLTLIILVTLLNGSFLIFYWVKRSK